MSEVTSPIWSTEPRSSDAPEAARLRLYRKLVSTLDATILADALSVLEVTDPPGALTFVVATARARDLLAGVTVRWGRGIAGHCAERGRSVICNDVHHGTGFLDLSDRLFRFRTESVLCSPIVRDGAVVGVVEVVNRLDGDGFGSAELEQVSALTRRMGRCWSDDPAACRALFDAAVLHCRQLMDIAGISLLVASDPGVALTFRHSLTTIETGLVGCRLGRGQGIAGWACQNNDAVLVPDVRQDERFFRGVDTVSSFTSRSLIAVPFRCGGRVLGVLELINSHLSEPFGVSELATARELVRRLEEDLDLFHGA